MSKTYKIKKQDYYSKGEIQIEISEEIVTPVEIKKTILSVGSLEKTILFLQEKKAKMIEEIDAEIKQNQDILDSMQDKINKIEIKELPVQEIIN